MMSRVHELSLTESTEVWLRKRLGTTLTSAKTARKAFKGRNVMPIEITDIVDDYNYNINSVNLADQY
jgi:hypothetical protein